MYFLQISSPAPSEDVEVKVLLNRKHVIHNPLQTIGIGEK
jgi:hypothetical protein